MKELSSLARFIVDLKSEDIPELVRQTAAGKVLDTVCCGLGAKNDAQIQQAIQTLSSAPGESGQAGIWGSGRRYPLNTAILINAMMCHTLEMDDVHVASKAHIGAVVIPAVWTLAELLNASGQQLLLAVTCGYETMARIGMSLGVVSHRKRGWHVTGTAGTFGAAAACGKLLGLNEQQMLSALGLAGTQSSGVWAFLEDSATCKSLHAGRSAVNGCLAAYLAKAGMTGPGYILTAEDGGLFSAMTGEADAAAVSRGLGEIWEIGHMDNKPYPCCRSTHCAIDAALELRKDKGFSTADIAHIVVDTYEIGKLQCGESRGSKNPQTAGEARFSTPYTVAVAMLKGNVGLEHFSPRMLWDEELRQLLGQVEVYSCPEFTAKYPAHWGCRMSVQLLDGRELTAEIADAFGSLANPLGKQELLRKAQSLAPDMALDELLNIGQAASLPML